MTETTLKAGRSEWIGLAVLVLPCLLVSMDVSVLFFALPFISADLAPTGAEQLWIMDAYGFVLAGMLITMGSLGDRIGRRLLLMMGAGAFGVASVVAAYSTSAGMLIGTRALLGLAGATLMPSTLALVRNMFHDAGQRKTAIAVWTGAMTGGATIGPIVGGFLLEHVWWGSAFLINVPAMILLLALGPVLLPEYRAPESGRFDLPGAALSLAAVLPMIYGIKQTAIDGLEPLPVAALVAGLLLAAGFVRRQQTQRNPLIDMTLFRHRAFGASILVNVVTMFAFIGITLYTNQYLQLVHGFSPFKAALLSIAVVPVIVVAMAVSGILARRIRPAYVLASGMLVMTAGLAVLSQVRVDSPLWVVLAGAAALAAGFLMASVLTADLILAATPPERAGAASALSETGSEFGGALGMAILGSIGAAVYHHQMAGQVPAARETLAGAMAIAARLPGEAGTALIDAARLAFTQGMNLTAVAGGLVMATAAGVTVLTLRHLGVSPPAADTADTTVTPERELAARR